MSLLKLLNWAYSLGSCCCNNDVLAISKKLKKKQNKSQLIANIMIVSYSFT